LSTPTAASIKKVLVAHEVVLNRVVEMLARSNGAEPLAGLLSRAAQREGCRDRSA
jgi:hypothetical protein